MVAKRLLMTAADELKGEGRTEAGLLGSKIWHRHPLFSQYSATNVLERKVEGLYKICVEGSKPAAKRIRR